MDAPAQRTEVGEPLMAGFDETMRGLRSRAQQAIGDNARALAPHGHGPQTRAPTPPEKQWWNLGAKYEAADRIKGEMMRDFHGHNDGGDALRHAELSRRLASEIDPVTSYLAGVTHEIENGIPAQLAPFAPRFMREHAKENWHGQGRPERLMDDRNNAEGRRAAREGRAVDPSRLQISPSGPVPPDAPYQLGRR
jgi:hypothetical protein